MTTPTRLAPAHRLDERAKLDRRLELVPDTPPARGERGRLVAAGVLVLVLALGFGIWLLATRGTATEERAVVAEVQRDETAAQALGLAEQIRAECEAGRLAGAICEQADDVVAEPIPPVARDGVDGRAGRDGRDGVDGLSPGCLAEPAMCRGADAPPARDGTDGRDGVDGRNGEDGTDGAPGEPPAGFTFVDGTGTQQTCTRDPASPDDAAFYTCTAAAEDGGGGPPARSTLTLMR